SGAIDCASRTQSNTCDAGCAPSDAIRVVLPSHDTPTARSPGYIVHACATPPVVAMPSRSTLCSVPVDSNAHKLVKKIIAVPAVVQPHAPLMLLSVSVLGLTLLSNRTIRPLGKNVKVVSPVSCWFGEVAGFVVQS